MCIWLWIVTWLIPLQISWIFVLFCFFNPSQPRNLCLGLKYLRSKLYSWSVRSSESLGRTETEMLSSWIHSLPSLSRTQRKVGIWTITVVRDCFSWVVCSLLLFLAFLLQCQSYLLVVFAWFQHLLSAAVAGNGIPKKQHGIELLF